MIFACIIQYSEMKLYGCTLKTKGYRFDSRYQPLRLCIRLCVCPWLFSHGIVTNLLEYYKSAHVCSNMSSFFYWLSDSQQITITTRLFVVVICDIDLYQLSGHQYFKVHLQLWMYLFYTEDKWSWRIFPQNVNYSSPYCVRSVKSTAPDGF